MLSCLTWNVSRLAALGAGAALPRQQAAADETAQALTTILLLSACLLPVVMGVIGVIVIRFLSWWSRDRYVEQEAVVPAAPALPPGVHLPEPTIWPFVLAIGLMCVLFAIPMPTGSILEWALLAIGGLVALLGFIGWLLATVREFRPRPRQ